MPRRLVVLLFAVCTGWPQAQAPDPGTTLLPPIDDDLPFAIELTPGLPPILALGLNRFTAKQIATFLAGVEPFLARARVLPQGGQLTWRVDGIRGYLSVSTSPFTDGPAFLLTLQAEPVRAFEDASALLTTLTGLASRTLSHAPELAPELRSQPPPGTVRQAPGLPFLAP